MKTKNPVGRNSDRVLFFYVCSTHGQSAIAGNSCLAAAAHFFIKTSDFCQRLQRFASADQFAVFF